MAERYIEIFEENIENGKSVLSYNGFDHKMHDVNESVKDAVTKLWSVIKSTGVEGGAVPTPSWIDPATVTNTLTNVTTDNPAVRVEKGKPYEATIALSNSAKTYSTFTVTMGGGSDISSDVAAAVTGAAHKKKITIPKVTGNIVITATQST